MITKLTKLRIRSVDSVDRGAGVDCRVLIRKKHEEKGNNPMSEGMGVVSVAKRAGVAIAKGEIDQQTYAKLQQRLAQEQFPNDTIGVALSKFYATPHGAEMLNRGLRANYEAVQRATALGAYEPVAKAFGNPASRQSEYETPPHPEADETPHASGVDTDEPLDQQIERLMKERNISRDAAISILHRKEKLRKNQSW
jgi:hypothetical protein